jgi:hypothetical protein
LINYILLYIKLKYITCTLCILNICLNISFARQQIIIIETGISLLYVLKKDKLKQTTHNLLLNVRAKAFFGERLLLLQENRAWYSGYARTWAVTWDRVNYFIKQILWFIFKITESKLLFTWPRTQEIINMI